MPLSVSAEALGLGVLATCLVPFFVSPATFSSSIAVTLSPSPLAATPLTAPGTGLSTYLMTSVVLPCCLNSTKPIVSPNSSATATAIQAAGDEPLGFGMPAASRSSVTTAGPVTPDTAPIANGSAFAVPDGENAPDAVGVGPKAIATDGVKGVSDARTAERLSSTIATNSGNVLRG